MKKLLLIFTFVFPLLVNGQNWCPSGATWYYSFYEMFSFGYLKIEYTHDTMIQSKKCRILLKKQFGYTYPGVYDTVNLGKEYTYLDSNSNIVYRYFNNNFDTLYNYDANIGSTWKVHGMHSFQDSGIVVVDSIGETIINSDSLKSIYVSTVSGSCIGWYSAKIVERIGCINDYMFPNFVSCVADAVEGGNFRCYSDSTLFNYTSNIAPACDFLTSVNAIEKNPNQVKVFPNPSNGSFTVDFDNLKNVREIRILDLLGKIVFQQSIYNQSKINIDNLRSGAYILTVIDTDNKTIKRKIISYP